MSTTDNKVERNVLIRLDSKYEKVNEPWLENQAICIEEALIEKCPEIPGPSVTANFEHNGWEIDLTFEAATTAETYDKIGRVFQVVEEVAGIELVGDGDEVHSEYESNPGPEPHEPRALQPAC